MIKIGSVTFKLDNRIRQKWFWLPILSLVFYMLKANGAIEVPDDYDRFIDLLLTSLVGLGILVDPTTPGMGDVPTQE